jgi:hypothetical protein
VDASRAKPCAVAALLAALASCGKIGYDPVVALGAPDAAGPTYDATGDTGRPPDQQTPTSDSGQPSADGPADTPPDAARPVDGSSKPDLPDEAPVTVDASAPRDTMEAPADSAADRPPDPVLVASGQHATPRRGGSGAGVVDLCRDGDFLIGFQGTASPNRNAPVIQSLLGVCATISFPNVGSPTALVTHILSTRGNTSGDDWSRVCPEGHVLVGFDGNAGTAIGQLVLACAPISLDASRQSVVMGSDIELDDVGASAGTDFPQTDCPAGQAARGAEIRAGSVLEAFGLVCGTLSLR